jgi:hypothetical protein
LQPDKFGVCLGTATSPGVVSLGGADPAFYSGEMQYAPITSPEGYYAVVSFTSDCTALLRVPKETRR